MGWVRRASPADVHRCDLPMREAVYKLPALLIGLDTTQFEHREMVVDGNIGDLWRCDDCGKRWRIGYACDACDHYGNPINPHRGMCTIGYKWRPATLMQRITHR